MLIKEMSASGTNAESDKFLVELVKLEKLHFAVGNLLKDAELQTIAKKVWARPRAGQIAELETSIYHGYVDICANLEHAFYACERLKMKIEDVLAELNAHFESLMEGEDE